MEAMGCVVVRAGFGRQQGRFLDGEKLPHVVTGRLSDPVFKESNTAPKLLRVYQLAPVLDITAPALVTGQFGLLPTSLSLSCFETFRRNCSLLRGSSPLKSKLFPTISAPQKS